MEWNSQLATASSYQRESGYIIYRTWRISLFRGSDIVAK